MSNIPSWSAAVPGQATLAGQVNQFLVAHTATFTYYGSPLNSPSIDPSETSGDALGTYTQLAFRFFSGSDATLLNIGRVALNLQKIGAGCDIYLTLQGDTGGGPDDNILAACIVPAEWIPTSFVTNWADFGFPLAYAMTSTTWYNVVFSPIPYAASIASTVDDVQLQYSEEDSGAYTYNGTGWDAQGYGYAVQIFSQLQTTTTSTQNLVNVFEDVGTLHKRYQYDTNNFVIGVQEWAAKSLTAPFNLLCRDDASFESGIGTYTSSGGSITLSQSDYALDGNYSLNVHVTTASIALVHTNIVNTVDSPQYISVTAGNAYSAMASVTRGVSSTVQPFYVLIAWYDASVTYIGDIGSNSVNEEGIGVWATATLLSAVAPVNAVFAEVSIIIGGIGTMTDEDHYIDCVGFFDNVNTVWSYPGAGIASSRAISYNSAGSPASAS
jgi:hypothetical protein